MKTAKLENRCKGMLNAALELFVKQGFHRTGISDIIKKSGGSLSTLYDVYKSKEGVLKALIELNSKKLVDELQKQAQIHKDEDLRDFLVNMGKAYIKLAKEKKVIHMKKIVIQDCQNAQTTTLFKKICLEPCFKIFIDFLSQPHISKQLKSQDYVMFTFRYFNLLEEPFRSWGKVVNQMYQGSVAPTQDDQLVEHIVDMFLYGFASK